MKPVIEQQQNLTHFDLLPRCHQPLHHQSCYPGTEGDVMQWIHQPGKCFGLRTQASKQ
ncbi:hypothetical protein [Polaromonas sp. CG9_12]|nr:hypothetical protein [Polaromonas sp. CG9_12]